MSKTRCPTHPGQILREDSLPALNMSVAAFARALGASRQTVHGILSVDSDEVADGVALDYDAQGALVGIDVQHASRRADIRRLSFNHLPLGSPEAA